MSLLRTNIKRSLSNRNYTSRYYKFSVEKGNNIMAYFRIEYGCGCGENEEYMIFNSQQEANEYAYQAAIDDYESYEGLHGIRSMSEIAEEDFGVELDELDYSTAMYIDIETTYNDERESQINYGAEEVSREEWEECVNE